MVLDVDVARYGDNALEIQATGIEYSYTLKHQILLERSEVMKGRGLSSPDRAVAIALTLAEPVAPKEVNMDHRPPSETVADWNPYAREDEPGYYAH